MDVDEVVVADELRSPDPVEELAATDHDAGIASERGEDVELGRREDDGSRPGRSRPAGLDRPPGSYRSPSASRRADGAAAP